MDFKLLPLWSLPSLLQLCINLSMFKLSYAIDYISSIVPFLEDYSSFVPFVLNWNLSSSTFLVDFSFLNPYVVSWSLSSSTFPGYPSSHLLSTDIHLPQLHQGKTLRMLPRSCSKLVSLNPLYLQWRISELNKPRETENGRSGLDIIWNLFSRTLPKGKKNKNPFGQSGWQGTVPAR